MKLSEAIRLGAALSPQGKGGSMNRKERCALASAADACGFPPSYDTIIGEWIVPYVALERRFPILKAAALLCPSCRWTCNSVEVTIWHLNDRHGWTREQIADWVEAREREQEATELVAEAITT